MTVTVMVAILPSCHAFTAVQVQVVPISSEGIGITSRMRTLRLHSSSTSSSTTSTTSQEQGQQQDNRDDAK
eukprot:CAMPEP_0203675790 /NCGR_PEP_ID=MMETSP0090-20130426/22164_1 /ASSEMBLY_ACC=CAM_ASM_001088 /TAXON_ID=426623 /ORGANISM="Chaetoceros affinis, Strain CCMP159" /LENGTH=70 /DNA_ID=CAMNT_0050542119 /DNA_START=81 /DNA_END=290 /DNA_ORIENTATION=+